MAFSRSRTGPAIVIISGGSNIYPREVEEVLLLHPRVREVAVVGQRDAEWGEVVVAFLLFAGEGGAVPGAELWMRCAWSTLPGSSGAQGIPVEGGAAEERLWEGVEDGGVMSNSSAFPCL